MQTGSHGWPSGNGQGNSVEALILAAGCGSRLGKAANQRPKCLVDIGGKPLIYHQVKALKRLGVDRFIVAAGYQHRRVGRYLKRMKIDFDLIVNESYTSTNSLYTLSLAEELVEGPLLMLNSDVLFADSIVERLLNYPSAVAYDSSSGYSPEHMKVRLNKTGRLKAISKRLKAKRCDGESTGIVKLDLNATYGLFDATRNLIAKGKVKNWAPAGLAKIVAEANIAGVDISDLPWTEIDTPGDLKRARAEVWPRIKVLRSRGSHRGKVPAAKPLPAVAGVTLQ